MVLFFFFFKQKTAYEMRISDWSSDVCSSDLCHYDIRLHDPAALILDVTARCDGTGPVTFDRPGEAGMAAALESFAPGADGRSVQYRFRLGELAALAASPEVAQRIGPAVISPLSVWLSQPDLTGNTPITTIGRAQVHNPVTTPPSLRR